MIDWGTTWSIVMNFVFVVLTNVRFLSFPFLSFPFLCDTTSTTLAGDCSFPSGRNINYQSAAATAASDKSLSDTLMPSNCLETPLQPPVCCLSRIHPPPRPEQIKLRSTFPSQLHELFYPQMPFHVDSIPFRTSRLHCATGVGLSPRMKKKIWFVYLVVIVFLRFLEF
ncbi:hypothetical protein XENORESO_010048 [Xenotaenia resolanae]|uniref:Uncharacterized protein n=1 Tax=Xenotaenia resolanae TaxID=208358 RepID=A0ABV0W228_9TELE